MLLITGSIHAQNQEKLPAFNPRTFEKTLVGLDDTTLVKVLDSVSQLYANRNPDEGIRFIDFALRYLEQKNVGRKRHGGFYLRRAQKYSAVKKYALALNDLLKAEEIFLKFGNESGMQQVFITYANLYTRSSQNVKAIQYALKAKDYSQKLGETESMGVAYNTLANLYKEQKNTDSAMYYYRKSLRLVRLRKNHIQEALSLDNISMLHAAMGHIDSAAIYNRQALNIAKAKKDTYLELQLLLNTVSVYEARKDHETQLRYSLRAKYLADSIRSYPYQVYTEMNLGSAYISMKRTAEGMALYRRNIPRLLEFGDLAAVATAYDEMSKGFETLHMPDSALYYFKQGKAQADSVEKIKAMDEVNELLARHQMEEQEQKIEHLNEMNRSAEEKNALKSAIIWVSVCLLLVIIVLLVITFKRFRDNKKLNVLLEHKNTEITDSINYAQRIQVALLPDEKQIKTLLPESFIFFRPKDIVSGDFYWVASKDNLVFVAAGDCTGHGVPGGFMSMLGHSFLNEIIIDKHIHDPGKVLDVLRERVIRALKQTGATGENKDGMDISLAVIDRTNGVFTHAAANNPLYLVSQGALTELKADKQPIGFYGPNMQSFVTQRVNYQAGDRLFLFTDGYADQFGGDKGKKMLYKRMKEQVLAGSTLPVTVQGSQLETHFMTWKGGYDQVDDVCIIGISL